MSFTCATAALILLSLSNSSHTLLLLNMVAQEGKLCSPVYFFYPMLPLTSPDCERCPDSMSNPATILRLTDYSSVTPGAPVTILELSA